MTTTAFFILSGSIFLKTGLLIRTFFPNAVQGGLGLNHNNQRTDTKQHGNDPQNKIRGVGDPTLAAQLCKGLVERIDIVKENWETNNGYDCKNGIDRLPPQGLIDFLTGVVQPPNAVNAAGDDT